MRSWFNRVSRRNSQKLAQCVSCDQLGECAAPVSRGLQWPWDLSTGGDNRSSGSMPGWCNGSAGQVFLWTAAHQALGENRYLELAEGAAWHVWEKPTVIGNLCCGMAGQSYALLNLYRHPRRDLAAARPRCSAPGSRRDRQFPSQGSTPTARLAPREPVQRRLRCCRSGC